MAHGGHDIDEGPSAKKYMTTAGTNLSGAAGTFLAATGSPFTHPSQFEREPKVPDTKVALTTNYAYIAGRIQVPMVNMGNGRGDQLIIMNANPLSHLPLVWCETRQDGVINAPTGTLYETYKNSAGVWVNERNNQYNITDPNYWAHKYNKTDLSTIASQCKALGEVSQRHRIVGAGLRVNSTKSSTVINRGQIEGGLFEVDQCRQRKKITDMFNPNPGTQLAAHWPTDSGYVGQALVNDTIFDWRDCIRPAKTEKLGYGHADEGCTVRWVPNTDYNMIQSVNYNLVVPLYPAFPNGVPCTPVLTSGVWENTTVVHLLDQTVGEGNSVSNDAYDHGDIFAVPAQPVGTAGSYISGYTANTPKVTSAEVGTVRKMYNTQAGPQLAYMYYSADPERLPNNYIGYMSPLGREAMTASVGNFENAMYVDIQGADATALVTIDVVWHVEYVPKDSALHPGKNSPVDLNWPTIQAMASNATIFPIVVKGNSFFTSLRHAVGKALKAFNVAAPVVGSLLSAAPDPRLRAAGMGLTAASSVTSRF